MKITRPFRILTEEDGFFIDLRYATERNFTGRNLYGSFDRFALHEEAAEMFLRAVQSLRKLQPHYRFLVLDGLRPHSIQIELFDVVKGTPMEAYVAHPDRGSVHNYGFAMDLTILDGGQRELDMGTEFDFFGELAEPRHESRHLQDGTLSTGQHENRLLLRGVMQDVGFQQLATEWWHFNGRTIQDLKKLGYPRVDFL